jgi:phosphotransacetylase
LAYCNTCSFNTLVEAANGKVELNPPTKLPVNDLSRGALVDDIVFTIALTAIQAQDLAA